MSALVFFFLIVYNSTTCRRFVCGEYFPFAKHKMKWIVGRVCCSMEKNSENINGWCTKWEIRFYGLDTLAVGRCRSSSCFIVSGRTREPPHMQHTACTDKWILQKHAYCIYVAQNNNNNNNSALCACIAFNTSPPHRTTSIRNEKYIRLAFDRPFRLHHDYRGMHDASMGEY